MPLYTYASWVAMPILQRAKHISAHVSGNLYPQNVYPHWCCGSQCQNRFARTARLGLQPAPYFLRKHAISKCSLYTSLFGARRRGHGIQICLGPRSGCHGMSSGKGTLSRAGLGLLARPRPRNSDNDKMLGSACCIACSSPSSSLQRSSCFFILRLIFDLCILLGSPLFDLWSLNLLAKRTSSCGPCGSACGPCGSACGPCASACGPCASASLNKLSSKAWAAWAS